MSSKSFKELIAIHLKKGTCYLCRKRVVDGEGIHALTGAHWNCHKAEEDKVYENMEKMGVRLRKKEGEGKVALKAKELAVAAIEKELGTKLESVTIWNQQGVYRGPRWDLDSWGLHFSFELNGHVHTGDASSLATMTKCVAAKKMKAVKEKYGFSFALYPKEEHENSP